MAARRCASASAATKFLNLEITALESDGKGKVISSPRVVTLDNRKASIEQGVSIPFQTFEDGDAKLEFIDAVLSLDVTPHITADESIIMEIEVTRNAPDSTVPTPTGSPAIAKNEATTETLVKDGQTLVIGGIYGGLFTATEGAGMGAFGQCRRLRGLPLAAHARSNSRSGVLASAASRR